MAALPSSSVNLSWLAELYNSPEYSDIKVRCNDRDFHAHESVLCKQSPFFARTFKNGFKETEESVIEFQDDPVEAVEAMLRFCYFGTYDDLENPFYDLSKPKEPFLLQAQLYVLASKYEIDKLTRPTVEGLKKHLPNAKDKAYLDVVDYVYSNTTSIHKDVRGILVGSAIKRYSGVCQRNWYLEKDPSVNQTSVYLTITFLKPWLNLSCEEVRIEDYAKGKKYGDGRDGPPGSSADEKRLKSYKAVLEALPDFALDVALALHREVESSKSATNKLVNDTNGAGTSHKITKPFRCHRCRKFWTFSRWTWANNSGQVACPYCSSSNGVDEAEQWASNTFQHLEQ